MVNNKTLINLEFYKIMDMLKNNCITFLGKQLVEELYPSSDINKILNLQKETSEACSFVLRKSTPPIAPIIDLKNIVSKLNIGSILSIEELLKVANTLKIFRDVKEYYKEDSILRNKYFKSLL